MLFFLNGGSGGGGEEVVGEGDLTRICFVLLVRRIFIKKLLNHVCRGTYKCRGVIVNLALYRYFVFE